MALACSLAADAERLRSMTALYELMQRGFQLCFMRMITFVIISYQPGARGSLGVIHVATELADRLHYVGTG